MRQFHSEDRKGHSLHNPRQERDCAKMSSSSLGTSSPTVVRRLRFSKAARTAAHPLVLTDAAAHKLAGKLSTKISEEQIPSVFPSRAVQLQSIQQLLLDTDDTQFAVATDWWKKWQDCVETLAPSPGPVDNSCIAGKQASLVPSKDFILVPRFAWEAFVSWYGCRGPQISAADLAAEQSSLDVNQEVSATGPTSTKATTGGGMNSPAASEINLKLPLKICSNCFKEGTALRDCSRCKSVQYCSKDCQRQHWKIHKPECKCAATNTRTLVVKGRAGRCGLQNLGNTCFMNSIIQCMSHTMVLTNFFLSSKHKEEINTDNPLGFGGKVAMHWGDILNRLWHGKESHINPMKFKRAATALAQGRFSGFRQHDSQEFLAFFLDGLHEDLNRVRQKPYIEEGESDGTDDDSSVAAEAWDNFKKRNDSIVSDHIYGQHKSTLTCPKCNRVSVTFDPFNLVTLPINPVSTTSVYFVKRHARRADVPDDEHLVVHSFNVSSTTILKDLKMQVGRRHNISTKCLLSTFVTNGGVLTLKLDTTKISSLSNQGMLVLYEIEPKAEGSTYVIVMNGTGDMDTYGLPIVLSFLPQDSPLKVREQLLAQKLYFESTKKRAIKSKLAAVYCAKKMGRIKRGEFDVVSDMLGHLSLSATTSMNTEWRLEAGKICYAKAIWSERLSPSVIDYASDDVAEVTSSLTLDKCFKDYMRPEILNKSNLWYCNKCEEHVAATKQMGLWKLPDVMILHLKRFEYRNPLVSSKIGEFVDFPLESLNLGQYCCGTNQSDEMYDLYAVSNHYGRMGFGHYTAYARSGTDQRSGSRVDWYEFNDTRVNLISSRQIKSEAAYVLFYRRRRNGCQ